MNPILDELLHGLPPIQVPAWIFWPFLTTAFSLFYVLLRRNLGLKDVVKESSQVLPKIVQALGAEKGTPSMLPPALTKPRKKLDTLTSIDNVRKALGEGMRIADTRVRATDLPEERPFVVGPPSAPARTAPDPKLSPTDITPAQSVQALRRVTPLRAVKAAESPLPPPPRRKT